MLTPREAFKVGFLSRCVEEGLSQEETAQRIKAAAEKTAGFWSTLGTLAGAALGAGRDIGKAGLSIGVPVGLAAPPVLGGLTGYGLARLTGQDEADEEEIKAQELIDEYRRQQEQLERSRTRRV